MKLAWCSHCSDYTLGTRNIYCEGIRKTHFWHICDTCTGKTDSFIQKQPHDNNAPRNCRDSMDIAVVKNAA